MATHQQDVERGPEMSQIGPGNVPVQSSAPMQSRDMPRSFLPTAQPHVPSRPTSQYPSALQQNLDSPVLAAFRYHIGIHSDPSLVAAPQPPQTQPQDGSRSKSVMSMLAGTLSTSNTTASSSGFVRPVSNLGIYSRVIAAERKYHREYQVFAVLINGALGLQIIFAAALTALGAGNGPHMAVTAFGALNTVLAGLLTFLKGSGLPNRLKYYENEWTKLREYIEQRERDFATDAHQGRLGYDELVEEISIIEMRYEGVRKDIEANTPDSYVSMSNAIRALNMNHNNHNQNNNNNNNTSNNSNNNNFNNSTNNNTNQPPLTGLAGKLSRLNSQIGQHNEDARNTAKDLDGRIRSGVTDLEHRFTKGWNDLEKQTSVHIREVVDESTNRARDAGKEAEYRINNIQHNIGDGLRRTQSTADTRLQDAGNRIYDTQAAARSKLYNAQNSMQSGVYNAQNAATSTIHEAQNAAQSSMNDAQNSLYNAQTSMQSGLYNAQNTAQASLYNAQNAATSSMNDAQNSLYNAQNTLNAGIHNAQQATSSAIHDAQTAAQQGYFSAQDAARSTVSNTQRGAQDAVHDAQATTNSRLVEERQHAEAKAKEMEDKIMMVAEKAAEKVLQLTKHRH